MAPNLTNGRQPTTEYTQPADPAAAASNDQLKKKKRAGAWTPKKPRNQQKGVSR